MHKSRHAILVPTAFILLLGCETITEEFEAAVTAARSDLEELQAQRAEDETSEPASTQGQSSENTPQAPDRSSEEPSSNEGTVIQVEPDSGRYQPVLRSGSLVWPIVDWPIDELDTARDVSYLTDREKDVVLHLNMARTNPTRYAAEFIEPRRQFYRGTLYREPGKPSNFAGYRTNEGIRAVDECVEVMNATAPLAPLQPGESLSRAAADHARDQSSSGAIGHTGSDGSSLRDRVKRYDDSLRGIGENIAYGDHDAREIVVQLLVDDGVPSRGHRENILRPEFRRVGLAIDSHPRYGEVCVMDFSYAPPD
jgi:uncharacterized protein YkwD